MLPSFANPRQLPFLLLFALLHFRSSGDAHAIAQNTSPPPPEKEQLLVSLSQPIRSLAVSPDGSKVAFSFADEPNQNTVARMELWDLQTKQPLRRWTTSRLFFSLVFSPDGQVVAGASADAKARLWSIATGKVLKEFQLPKAMRSLNTIAFSPDGQVLYAGTGSGELLKWDTHSGQLISSRNIAALAVESLAVSPDGNKIAAVCSGWYNNTILGEQATLLYNSVKLYNTRTNQLQPEVSTKQGPEGVEISSSYLFPLSSQTNSKTLAFSPNGATLAAASFERLLLADLNSEKAQEMVLPADQKWQSLGWIDAVAFAPDGKLVASATRTGLICLWDANTRQLVSLLNGSKSGVKSLAFALDGQTLTSGSTDGQVKLWSM